MTLSRSVWRLIPARHRKRGQAGRPNSFCNRGLAGARGGRRLLVRNRKSDGKRAGDRHDVRPAQWDGAVHPARLTDPKFVANVPRDISRAQPSAVRSACSTTKTGFRRDEPRPPLGPGHPAANSRESDIRCCAGRSRPFAFTSLTPSVTATTVTTTENRVSSTTTAAGAITLNTAVMIMTTAMAITVTTTENRVSSTTTAAGAITLNTAVMI